MGEGPRVRASKVRAVQCDYTPMYKEMTQADTSPPTLAALEQVLREHWGLSAFRPSQVPVVLSGASGGDTLAILPTGGGKSICYQIPGLVRGGICLVISPLVALMADQVQGLRARGIAADALTSGLRKGEAERILGQCPFRTRRVSYLWHLNGCHSPIFRRHVKPWMCAPSQWMKRTA